MTALRHLGHANEGTSVMAFGARLNYQSAGNLYSELMGIFLECVTKCVFEIVKVCKLSTIWSCRREVIHRRRQGSLSKLSLKPLPGAGVVWADLWLKR